MLFVVKMYFLVAAMPRCTTIRHLVVFLERLSCGHFHKSLIIKTRNTQNYRREYPSFCLSIKFRRRDARGNQTSAQLRRLGISSTSASPCSMLIQHRFAFLNLRPSLRIDESQEELSVPQSRDCKQNIVYPNSPPAARRT